MAVSESAQAMVSRLRGMQEPRGMRGILGRGSNVYSGGSPQAQIGGGQQFGRPPQELAQMDPMQRPQGTPWGGPPPMMPFPKQMPQSPVKQGPMPMPERSGPRQMPQGNAFGLRAKMAGMQNPLQMLAQRRMQTAMQPPQQTQQSRPRIATRKSPNSMKQAATRRMRSQSGGY